MKTIATRVLVVLLLLPWTGAFAQQSQQVEPQGSVVSSEVAVLYTVVPNDATDTATPTALTSTFYIYTDSSRGSYSVCVNDCNSPVPVQSDQGIKVITLSDLGVQPGSGPVTVYIRSADADTVGVSTLEVQSQNGGIAFPEGVTVLLTPQSTTQLKSFGQ
jgi:hypothetical protein